MGQYSSCRKQQKDLFLTISDKSGNVLNSRKVTTSGDKFEKFVFYGGVGKIQLDNFENI